MKGTREPLHLGPEGPEEHKESDLDRDPENDKRGECRNYEAPPPPGLEVIARVLTDAPKHVRQPKAALFARLATASHFIVRCHNMSPTPSEVAAVRSTTTT